MKLVHRVLAATDLSAPSLRAVERGFEIARTTSASYAVVHALGLDALGPLRSLLGEQAENVASRVVDKARSDLAAAVSDPARSKGVEAEVLVEQGLAASVVPAHARTLDADLVVVGSRGQHTLSRLLIGSTASHLLRKSRCPVLVVKTPCRGSYERALIPIDFSPASVLAIRMTREIAPHADIDLLNVFDVPFEGMLAYAGVTEEVVHRYRMEARQDALHRLHELARAAGLTHAGYSVSVERGDAARTILEQAGRQCHDLVVMGKHGTHVTEELLLGSVTRRVLGEALADLLVVVDKRLPTPEGE